MKCYKFIFIIFGMQFVVSQRVSVGLPPADSVKEVKVTFVNLKQL